MDRRSFFQTGRSAFNKLKSIRQPPARTLIGGKGDLYSGFPSSISDEENPHHYRPVQGSINESNINHGNVFATNGPYFFQVTDTSNGVWHDSVFEGDRVRASNNHVYARSNQADLGERIVQPATAYLGGTDDTVGRLAGYAPIKDGASVDVAFRGTDPTVDRITYQNINRIPDKAVRSGYENLEYVRKHGVRTDTTEGINPRITSTTIAYSIGNTRLKKVLQVESATGEKIVGGGDSGSPAFDENGNLVGLVFGRSRDGTKMYICTIKEIERAVGVEFWGGNKIRDELRLFDIDNNGEHNVFDAIKNYNTKSIDVDGDGKITALDAVEMYNNQDIYQRRRNLLFDRNT